MKKIKPVLKRLHSPDIFDLKMYSPPESDCFGVLMQVIAGPVDEEGEESFDIIVCTPQWLSQRIDSIGVLMGRHHIFVKEYSYTRILNFIEDYFGKCEGENWEEVAEKLGNGARNNIRGWLREGWEYPVISIEYAGSQGLSFRIISDDNGTPVLFESSMFEITDARISTNWIVVSGVNNLIQFMPAKWSVEGFWRRYFDGERNASEIFAQEVEAMLDE